MAKSYVSRPPGTCAVRVDLPEEMMQVVKVLAAKSGNKGFPLSRYCREVILEAARAGKVLKEPKEVKSEKK